jgi:type I restriction enzyme S subunit
MPAFESLQILLPPVEEQLKIATIMDAHDAEISTMNATIGQYRAIKSGLLTDLLTGKVRVTP